MFFNPLYRLGHAENYSFLSSSKKNYGWKYPTKYLIWFWKKLHWWQPTTGNRSTSEVLFNFFCCFCDTLLLKWFFLDIKNEYFSGDLRNISYLLSSDNTTTRSGNQRAYGRHISSNPCAVPCRRELVHCVYHRIQQLGHSAVGRQGPVPRGSVLQATAQHASAFLWAACLCQRLHWIGHLPGVSVLRRHNRRYPRCLYRLRFQPHDKMQFKGSHARHPVLLFSKLNKTFFWYFDPEKNFFK